MSNVMIVKLSLSVFKKGDDLAIITFEKVTIAKSLHSFPQTLPQSQTQTQARKTHVNFDRHAEIFEFFTIGVSVRLSDRFNVTQNKINFVKNCPQWGWKPGPPDLQASALSTELSQHSAASLNLHCLYKVMLY